MIRQKRSEPITLLRGLFDFGGVEFLIFVWEWGLLGSSGKSIVTYLPFCLCISGSSFFGKIENGQFAELTLTCQNQNEFKLRRGSKFTMPHSAVAFKSRLKVSFWELAPNDSSTSH